MTTSSHLHRWGDRESCACGARRCQHLSGYYSPFAMRMMWLRCSRPAVPPDYACATHRAHTAAPGDPAPR